MLFYKVSNEAGRIEANFPLNLTEYAFLAYKMFNPNIFDTSNSFPCIFKNTAEVLCKAHKQPDFITYQAFPFSYKAKENNKKVLLACSGGLDSIYQAVCLKENDYDVTLFHVENLNYYTNGKEKVIVNDIAKILNMPLITVRFVANTESQNPYKKYWAENSFKDMLFYCIMLDYTETNDIYNISSGDDLSLSIEKAVVGTNLSDARQVTLTFIDEMKKYYDFNFIPTEQNHKGIRLKKLSDYNLLDSYYSCVNPGRFNQQNKKRTESKFGVKLYKHNCGVCRKCAFHNLLRHYYLGENFPQEFIDFCWKKIANGADNIFFNEQLPLEVRIKNLYEY